LGMKPTRKLHSVPAALSGLRRIDYMKIVEADQPRFYVVGIGHRFPAEREVSPTVARALLGELPCQYQWRRAVNEAS
jgi:hypothetical protein